jgi:signal peptidase I
MKNSFKIKITKKDLIVNAMTVLFLLLIKMSVFGNFEIPTGSMNPSIIEGDRIFSNNVAYGLRIPMTDYYLLRWNVPQRGDIIAFDPPPQAKSKVSFAKRVIAIPGDKIKIDGEDVILNGSALAHKYLKESDNLKFCEENLNGIKYTIQFRKYNAFNDHPREFSIPDGFVFVMGDNRDNSFDSRYWGFVPIDSIMGKLGFRYFSKDKDSGKIKLNKIGLLE